MASGRPPGILTLTLTLALQLGLTLTTLAAPPVARRAEPASPPDPVTPLVNRLEFGRRLLNIVPPPGFVLLPAAHADLEGDIELRALSAVDSLAIFITEEDARRLASGEEAVLERFALVLPPMPDGAPIRADAEAFGKLVQQLEARFRLDFEQIRQKALAAHAQIQAAFDHEGLPYPQMVAVDPLEIFLVEPWGIAFGQRYSMKNATPEEVPLESSNLAAMALINLQERPLNLRLVGQRAEQEDEVWLRGGIVAWLHALQEANPAIVEVPGERIRVRDVSLDDLRAAERSVLGAAAVVVIGLIVVGIQLARWRRKSDRELQFQRDQLARKRNQPW